MTSSGFIAYEDLKIHNLVHNRHLSKSISDASWGTFLQWVNYHGTVYNIPVMAVPPQFTTQGCSACETRVKKSLSIRTHVCPTCGAALDRDENAALSIRYAGLIIHLFMDFAGTVGQTGTSSDEENASGQNATTRRSRGRKTPTRRSPRGKAGKRAG